MPKIPAPGSSNVPDPNVPVVDPNTPAGQAVTPTGELGSQGGDNLATLRAAAESIGVDFSSVPPEEYGFFEALASGDLDSLGTPGNALAPPDPATNPLIPTGDETTPTPPPTEPLGVTPEPVAEGAGVGLGSDAPEGTGGEGEPGNAAVPTLPTPPSMADGEIPPMVGELVDLGNGILLTREQIRAQLEAQNAQQQITPDEMQMLAMRRQGLIGYQMVDPATGLPIQAAPQQQQMPPPPPDWLDPVAYDAYQQYQQQTNQTLQQILDNQRQMAQQTIMQEQAAIVNAVDEARVEFMTSKGMDPTDPGQVQRLDTYLERSGFLVPARDQYPGDPKSAIKAAYGAVYGSIGEYQTYERDRIIAQHAAETARVNQMKAAGQAVTSSPGTVSRETPPPKTVEERMAAAATMIENDPQFQSSRG